MLNSYQAVHVSREHIADFKAGRNQVENDTGNGGQSTTSSSIDGRAGLTTRPARPSAELNQSSSADGRARSNMRPAWPSAELNQSFAELDRTRDQLGNPPCLTNPVRRMAELNRTHNQLGHPPSWTSPVRRMAELERSCCLHLVLAASPFRIRTNMLSFHFDRSHRWNFTI
uniref:Uncharacterized protein n=1 Tax=Brassica campestris TaxID=3711 RepID=M4EWK6_BRACM